MPACQPDAAARDFLANRYEDPKTRRTRVPLRWQDRLVVSWRTV